MSDEKMKKDNQINENPNEKDASKKEEVREIIVIEGVLSDDKILVAFDPTAQTLHEKNYFGTKLSNEQLELDIIEALLLKERNRIKIFTSEGKEISAEEILARTAQQDPQIWIRYLVYRDLRQRGYIARLGYGQDIHFRIFPRGANPSTDIAKYFVYILEEENAVHLDTLDTITTQTLNSRKNLLLATVDRLGDITYYQLDQFSLPLNQKNESKW
ncbi:MAG: tRNA-intron lyase [Promethearchaeota archaeon]